MTRALAQGVPLEIQGARRPELRVGSSVQDAVLLSRSVPLAAVRAAVGERFLAIDDEGRAHVEIVSPEGSPAVLPELVLRFGGLPDTRWRDRLDAWLPLSSLFQLAEVLPQDVWILRASGGGLDQAPVAGQGPASIGSDFYRDGGANGAGLTLAVIDVGFAGLTAARNNGDAPSAANTTPVNYAGGGFETGSTHGTGCLEAAFDHCPGATWRLYRIDSVADLGTAVSDAIANGVDVITHSLSHYNQGWADDSGGACAAATQAANAGILFFTSAGNRAREHWQGTFNPGNWGPNRHDWATGDEGLTLAIAPQASMQLHLSWNTGGGAANYDLRLLDPTTGATLASSTAGGQTFEELGWTNGSAASVLAMVVVDRVSGPALEMELLGINTGSWEYLIAAGSTTSPSNTTHPRVFSVAAVPWGSFASLPGTSGILASYSSQGPSNSGMLLPDIAGVTDTVGFTYPGGFGGTSCATPNVAGAACAFWSSVPQFNANSIRWLIREQAHLHRDWGNAGPDNLYGYGGASLAPFAPNTVWLARNFGNFSNSTDGPYYALAPAFQAAVAGGRLLVLPGNYPEVPPALPTAVLIESYEGSPVLGN